MIKIKPYFISKKHDIRIYNQDFLDFNIDEKVDLIITSPPYNINKIYGKYKDDIPYNNYIEFTEKWLKKAYELSADDGRIFINIPIFTIVNGEHRYNGGDLYNAAIKEGWKFQFDIIWYKMFIACKTSWGSYLSPSAPSMLSPCEQILVFYKNQWKKLNKGESDIEKDEFIKWTTAYWNFPGQQSRSIGNHPAPFPVELPKRCLKLFSYKNDFILDPFLGSGSTLIAALENERRGIGVEIDTDYCNLAKERIKDNKIFNVKKFNEFNSE